MALHRPKLLHVSTLLSKLTHEDAPSHTTKMSHPACPSCERALATPPTVTYLLKTYPDSVTPQYALNRRILRCKHCDLVEANKRAIDVELPPPEYKNPVSQIEKHMEEARRFIADGVRQSEMEMALVRMEARRRETILRKDEDIRLIWEKYWGIWGPEPSGIGSFY